MQIRDRIKSLRRVKASELIPNPKNWRTHPQAQQDAMRGILSQIGYADAVLVRETPEGLMLIDGHLRAEITPDIKIPVLVLDVTEAETDLILATHDPLAAMAETNAKALDELLATVEVDNDELQAMLDELAVDAGIELEKQPEIVEDAGPQMDRAEELQQQWKVESGQLWVIEGKQTHKLLCGDSTKAADVDLVMGGELVDAVVSDPPYGMEFRSNYRKNRHKAIAGDTCDSLLLMTIDIDASHSKYIFCRWDNIGDCPKPKSVITWIKNNWSMGDLNHEHARQTECILFYPGSNHSWPGNRPTDAVTHARTGNDKHPTEKPVSLLAEVVGWTAGNVFDPFLGSGTTMVAAEQLNRKCYGIEIEPKYCAVILERMKDLGCIPQLSRQ